MNIFSENTHDDFLILSGSIESIVYQNDENGYTVCHIDADGEDYIAVGIMPYANVG